MPDQVTESMGTLARGISINLFGSGFNITSRFVFNVLVARLLGPREVGIYYLALTVAYIMGMIAVGGLDTTLIRYLARHRMDNDWSAFRGTLHFGLRTSGALGLAGSVCLLVGGPWMAATLFHKPELTIPLRIVALYVPLAALEAVLLAATQSFKQMKYKVYIEAILNPTLRIVLAVSAYLMGGRVYAVLSVYVFSLLICAILSYLALRRCITVDLAFYPPATDYRELINYTAPLFGVSILSMMIMYIDTLVLAHFRSAVDVGLYSVCIRLTIIEGFFLGTIGQIFGPMISELHHRGEIDQLNAYSKVVTLWAVEIFAPLALIVVIAPREILGIFGAGFRVAAPCFLILMVGQFFNFFTGPVGLIVNMAGWSRLQLGNMSVSIALQTVLAILLIPSLGIVGAAVANSSGVISLNLLQLFEVRYRLRIHPFSMVLAKPFLAALAGLAAAGLIGHYVTLPGPLHVALALAGMLFAYAGTLILLGFDKYSRIAWQQFLNFVPARLLPGPIGQLLGKQGNSAGLPPV